MNASNEGISVEFGGKTQNFGLPTFKLHESTKYLLRLTR